MARKLIVEILGDSKSLERSFTRSTAAANKFGRDVDTGLGRAEQRFSKLQKVAAGGFVAGSVATTGIEALKSVVTAAAESQQVLGQTRVALEAAGKSWDDYGRQIEDTIRVQSKLGFDDEALLRTFAGFVRGNKDVELSLRENALAADIARARFIDLETSAKLVQKAALGQAGALRRLGIDTTGATSGTELLALLTRKYGGAAQAASKDATTALDRVAVSTENLKESIGTILLPAVTLLADDLAAVADVSALVVTGLGKIGDTKIPVIEIPFNITIGGQSVGDLAGGLAHVAKFTPLNPLFGAFIAKAIADQFRDQAEAETPTLANDFARTINLLTTNALDTAAGQTQTATPKVKGFGTGLKPSDLFGPKITGIPKALQERLLDAEIAGKGIRETLVKQRDILANAVNDPRNNRTDRIKIKTALKGVKDQIAAIDADVAAGIKAAADARTARLKDAEEKAKRAREKHKALLKKIAEHQAKLAKEAKEALAARIQTRQFRAIGLGSEGDPIIPTVANLRKQFSQLGDNLEPGQLSSKLRKQFLGVGKLLRGDLGKVTSATRDAINELFKTIRDTFEKNTDDALTISPSTQALNKNRIVAGLGLDRDTERLIKSRLSGFNAAGRRLNPAPGTTGAFGVTLPPIHLNTTVNMDGQKVAQSTSVWQGKNHRSNPRQKRGPWSGGGWS